MNTNIKLIFIGLLFVLECTMALGQQDPQFTQYFFNPSSSNPAYAGTREALSVNLLVREQWLGIEGRPKTQTVTANSPIKNTKLSWGAGVIADQHGPVKSTYFNLDGAYKFKVSEKSTLSLGLRASMHMYKANFSELQTGGDVSFQNDTRSSAVPNFGFSTYLYAKDYFLGLSAPKLIENDLNSSEANNNVILEKRHYFLTAGKVFDLSQNLKLKPTLFLKYVTGAPMSIDLSLNLLIREKLWVGSFCRLGDAAGLLVSYQMNDNLRFGYSYDKTISGLSGLNMGSHELLINYDLQLKKEKTLSPRYF